MHRKGRKTSEFVVTIVTGVLSAGIGLGLIDPNILDISAKVISDAREASTGMDGSGLQAILDTIYKMFALGVGGYTVGAYSKSRGVAKSNTNIKEDSDEEDG